MYVVLEVHRDLEYEQDGEDHVMTLSFLDGMVGVLPVFDTREEAEDYANDEMIVVELVAWHEAPLCSTE